MFSRRFRTLRKTTVAKLTLWYTSIFSFSSLIVFGVTYVLLSSSLHDKDRKLIQTKMDEYTLMEQNSGMQALIREIITESVSNKLAGIFVRIGDQNGHTLHLSIPYNWKHLDINKAHHIAPVAGHDEWTQVKGQYDDEDDDDDDDDEIDDLFEIVSRRLPDGSLLQVGYSLEEREDLLESFLMVFTGILAPLVLVGLGGGLFLSFRALHPIRDLIHAVRNIDTGKMSARVPTRRTEDELDELVLLFNGMLGKIETLITGMRNTLDNVAHDLRTPMTRLRAVAETALQSEPDAKTLREALMDCAEESERILSMLSILMDISEAETGTMRLDLEQITLAPLIEEIIEVYQYAAEDKGITIRTMIQKELPARVDPRRMRQVVANLLDNAVKYTPYGGEVSVAARLEGSEVVILLDDTGPGIPVQDLPHIFERLYRGDESRSQPGLGLGLSLVHAVVHAHKGRVEVASRPGEGTQFALFLPVAP